MNIVKIITTVATLLAAVSVTAFAAPQDQIQIRRYLLSAGANNGGKDKVLLRYAVTDAKAFANVLIDMGGVEKSNALILSDPNSRELLGGIDNLGKLIAGNKSEKNVRHEAFIYYSGHADTDGLKLGGETLKWSDFRSAVNSLDADIRVAILDACGSGAITRTKGGIARPAFLADASTNMKGYAFLTSSNENEASQESDRIKGSYFTHALLGGLRGAADMTGDGKVTINEAYQYAFNETLRTTQNTTAGTQHPSRDMNLAGTGDIVMTDLRETSAMLSLDAEIEGRFFIRDAQGNLFAELNKLRGRRIDLGIPPGKYSIQMEAPSRLWMANDVVISEGRKTTLSMSDMRALQRRATAAKGGGQGVNDGSDGVDNVGGMDSVNISINEALLDIADSLEVAELTVVSGELEAYKDSLAAMAAALSKQKALIDSLTGMSTQKVLSDSLAAMSAEKKASLDSLTSTATEKVNVFNPLLDSACRAPYRFNVNLVATSDKPDNGMQLSFIGNIAHAEYCGTQVALGFNFADKDMNGAQISMLNMATGRFNGAQLSYINIITDSGSGIQGGIINLATDNFKGVQGGITNLARDVGYIQGGIANLARDVGYIQGGIVNIARDVGYIQGGITNIAAKRVGYVQSGIMNIAGDAGVFQGGIVNIAGKSKYQVGIVNISGYSEGTPIGLLNIVGNGIIDITFYGDLTEDMPSLSLRTGTPWFYTVIEWSRPVAQGFNQYPKMSGVGFGTRFGMNSPLHANVDFVWLQFYGGNFGWHESGKWYNYDNWPGHKLRAGGSYMPLPFIALTGGVSLNGRIEGDDRCTWPTHEERFGSYHSSWTNRGHRLHVWPGLYAGITVGKVKAGEKKSND
jgi:hypothetical protein